MRTKSRQLSSLLYRLIPLNGVGATSTTCGCPRSTRYPETLKQNSAVLLDESVAASKETNPRSKVGVESFNLLAQDHAVGSE